ncbi:MAG: hypothetical protein E4H02_12730, partial [Lentisphaerales bacterium]
MKITLRALIAVFVLALVVTSVTQAEIPFLIDCQGRLVDEVGNPLSTNVHVTVSIYNSETAGAEEYSEDIGVVPVQNGIYSFVFGTHNAALLAALTNTECWVELNVESQTLSPRIRLVSTPYSLYAREAERLGGKVADYYLPSNTWATSAASGITNAGSGMVISSAERSKLTAIEAGADVTDAENVDNAGAVMDSDLGSEGLVKRGPTSGSYSIVVDNSLNWDTAHGWGDHGTNGYLTGFTETDPVAGTSVWTEAQYPHALLADGTRAMTGDLDMGGNSV